MVMNILGDFPHFHFNPFELFELPDRIIDQPSLFHGWKIFPIFGQVHYICSCICFCFHLAVVCVRVCVCLDFQAFSVLSCTTCIQLINTLAVSINSRVLPHYLHIFFYSSFAFDCYYSVRNVSCLCIAVFFPKNSFLLCAHSTSEYCVLWLYCAVHAIGAYIFNGIQ